MNNENIRKINMLGKVCRILLIFARIALIVGIVGCIIVTAAFLMVPKSDVVTADGTVSAQIRVDTRQIPSIFSDDLIDIIENDIDFDAFGTSVKWNVEANKKDDEVVYDINGALDIDNSSSIVYGAVGTFAVGAIMCTLMFIIVIFGGKLAKAFETCSSPFEANVLKAMKRFAFSFIPIGVLQLVWNGLANTSTILSVFIILTVIIFSFIFSYGAQLQQESDETL